jgi:hypothetical protein
MDGVVERNGLDGTATLCFNCAMSSYLPVRLTRETPFKSQLGCTFAIAVVTLAVGALAWFAAGTEGKGTAWVGYVVGGAFGLVGLIVLWTFVRQFAAIGLKETIVEISREPLQPGETASICLIQPGPAKLKSLRANLVCMESRSKSVWNSEKKVHEQHREERLASSEKVLEATHLNVAAGDAWHEIATFSLPADAKAVGTVDGVTTTWKIEVWGTGYFLASFMHPFRVDVFYGEREEYDDADEEDEEEGESEK